MGDQLTLTPASLVPERDEIAALLERGGLQPLSIKRYLMPARSWETYCRDRQEDSANASTSTLIAWLDSRCRRSRSYESAVSIGLAAARHVQRTHALAREVEPLPYARSARPALDAWCASVTADPKPKKRARGLRLDSLATMVSSIRAHVAPRSGVDWDRAIALAKRDCALLLVGWWGAYRGDDLCRLTWPDIAFVAQGMEVTLSRAKGRKVSSTAALAIQSSARLCPVQALAEWQQSLASWRTQGSVFGLSTPSHVSRRFTALFAEHCPGHTGHSLRAGFATEAAAQGVPDKLVQHHARWASAQQHSEYVRSGRLWLDTPTTRLALPEME